MLKIKILILLYVAISIFFTACSADRKYFVAVDGSDENSGTITSPFATLSKARDAVRLIRKKNDNRTIKIIIREGTYQLKKTFELDGRDSGTKENAVIYTSFPGEHVYIQGGRAIPVEKIETVFDKKILNLFPQRVRSKIRQVNLASLGISNYGTMREVGFARPYGPAAMEVFLNNQPLHPARWPNSRYLPMGEIIDQGSVPRSGDFSNRGGRIKYNCSRPSRWKYSDNIFLCGYFMHGWAEDAVELTEIDTVSKVFTTGGPTLYGYGSATEDPNRRWYIYNVLEELDKTDEFYIDRKSGILYLNPSNKVKTLEVSLLQEPMFAIEGASNILIKNLVFENSRGMGIYLENTQNIRIQNCTFRNLGIVGVCIGRGIEAFENLKHDGSGKPVSRKIGNFQQHLYRNTAFNRQGSKNNGIIDCQIYQTGAGGIHLGGGDRNTLESAGNFVKNCYIHDYNRLEKSYRAGVDISGVGNYISHCEIFNAPAMAVLLHGNDHIIEFNDFHDVCLTVDDQSVIYYGRDPSERGHEIRNNYFHNTGNGKVYSGLFHGTSAVYHDDGACGMKVVNNIFYKAGYRTVLIGGGSDNTYNNNIFIESPVAIHVDNRQQRDKFFGRKGDISRRRLDAVNYSALPYSQKYPHLAEFWTDNPGFPKRNVISKNVFYKCGAVTNGDRNWLSFKNNNWITNDNPGFVDGDEFNFQLKPEAVVFDSIPGFKIINFNKIGIRER